MKYTNLWTTILCTNAIFLIKYPVKSDKMQELFESVALRATVYSFLFEEHVEGVLHTDGFTIILAWLPLGHGFRQTDGLGIQFRSFGPYDFRIGYRTILLNNKLHDTASYFLMRLDMLRKPLDVRLDTTWEFWHFFSYLVNIVGV